MEYADKIPSKEELLPGYVVMLRNGLICMVVCTGDARNKYIVSKEPRIAISFDEYNDLLKYVSPVDPLCDADKKDFDIMSVWGFVNSMFPAVWALDVSTTGHPLLWVRKDRVEMTVEEISEKLGYDVVIVNSH